MVDRNKFDPYIELCFYKYMLISYSHRQESSFPTLSSLFVLFLLFSVFLFFILDFYIERREVSLKAAVLGLDLLFLFLFFVFRPSRFKK